MIVASPLAALMVPLLLLSTPLSEVAPNQTTASMTALRQWVAAVNEHVPGEPDAAVHYVAGMTYSARAELNQLYPLFIKVLRGDFAVTGSEIDSDVAALAGTVRQRPGSEAFLKLMGVGMAAAILVDATVVRMVLVPAVMQLMGRANWWIPSWLDRALPRLDVEPQPTH